MLKYVLKFMYVLMLYQVKITTMFLEGRGGGRVPLQHPPGLWRLKWEQLSLVHLLQI